MASTYRGETFSHLLPPGVMSPILFKTHPGALSQHQSTWVLDL